MRYSYHRFVATPLLCAAAAACGSSKGTAPTPTGKLTVTVTGAAGGSPSVAITGPNGYTKTVTSTETLTGLAPGTYVVAADSPTVPDSVVGTFVDTANVSDSPATVTASAISAVTVAYAMKYRVGGMWVANNNDATIPELSANQLRTGGSLTPAETLATQVSAPTGLALDANGMMWEASSSNNVLLGYSVSARNAGGGTAPTITITSPSIQNAALIAIDGHGNLWVADVAAGLLEYTPSQLAATGTVSAAVTIAPGSVLANAEALAFDANGNAWVTDAGNAHVVEFSGPELARAGDRRHRGGRRWLRARATTVRPVRNRCRRGGSTRQAACRLHGPYPARQPARTPLTGASLRDLLLPGARQAGRSPMRSRPRTRSR